MSVIHEIYSDPKFYGACVKIAGNHADDLYQHVNLLILEKENAGTFACKNLKTYYYSIARNAYFNKSHSFRKQMFGRIQTTLINGTAPTDQPYQNKYESIDDFARLPPKSKSERFIKEVYLECTDINFKGIANLAHQTGINKRTIYGALYRFRKLYHDHLDHIQQPINNAYE